MDKVKRFKIENVPEFVTMPTADYDKSVSISKAWKRLAKAYHERQMPESKKKILTLSEMSAYLEEVPRAIIALRALGEEV